MKLEEALPHYRLGRRIISNADISYAIDGKGADCLISCAEETEMLGEWTAEEPPLKAVKRTIEEELAELKSYL